MQEGAVDFDLLQRLAAGDRHAGGELFARHYVSVRRFFEVKAGTAAEDLTQHTFLACVEACARFRRESSFRTFLFAIARRQLLQYLRKQQRTDVAMRLSWAQGPDTAITPTRLITDRHEQRLLLMALNWLQVELQMVVQLYYWEGLDGPQIAEVLEIPASTVRNRLSRARADLRQRIAQTAPSARVRDSLLGDLEGWTRSLADGAVRSPGIRDELGE
ncbi:MAG TPA: sigma-70 family RNA polymerase sigma factor [Nannocystaceae bacterium]|nr:sigma-70 family RNA polymerase sigma factor [Nannocystaceae bacterium]